LSRKNSERGRVLGGVGGVLALLGVVLLLVTFSSGPTPVLGDGQGSPADCLNEPDGVVGSVEGTNDLVTGSPPAGNVVTAVCIKSGTAAGHTGPLQNGFYDGEGDPASEADACYEVSGVGTDTVTVERVGDPSSECQAISHIDVLFAEDEETPTSTPTPTSTAVVPTATSTAMAADTPTNTPTPIVAVITPPTTGSGGLFGGDGSVAWFGLASLLAGLGLLGWARRQSTRR
jgi:hypothetical protein